MSVDMQIDVLMCVYLWSYCSGLLAGNCKDITRHDATLCRWGPRPETLSPRWRDTIEHKYCIILHQSSYATCNNTTHNTIIYQYQLGGFCPIVSASKTYDNIRIENWIINCICCQPEDMENYFDGGTIANIYHKLVESVCRFLVRIIYLSFINGKHSLSWKLMVSVA